MTTMKCHYEVLGVSRDASDDDLKKNYRKLALRWHPDKNLDNSDEAKEQFQLIQQAFEVLSDPQERAWYDNHREAILKGGLGSDFKDDSFDVFPYFTSSCYKGFGDDERGFYYVYREVFNKIAAEEADLQDENSDSDFEIPSFGSSTSDYEEVVHMFYAFWQSFSTRKSYAWLDQYDTRQAENRRVVRAMEKENKKFRDKARRERNEQVRALVSFVRKRDKRVEQYRIKLAERAKENAAKAESIRKKQLAERKKLLEECTNPESLKMDNMEGVLKEIESQIAAEFGESCSGAEVSNSEDEEVPNSLFCVACNKNFKTEKAFANHENSKKHKENVAVLKLEMEEEEQFGDEQDGEHSSSGSAVNSGEELLALSDQDLLSSEEEIAAPKKNKKNKKKMTVEELADSSDTGSLVDIDELSSSRKQRRRQEAKAHTKPSSSESASISAANAKDETELEQQPSQTTSKQKSKAKRTKAARQSNKGTNTKNISEPADISGVDTSHVCVKCSSSFQSRNKLFEHFKKTGHSVLLANSAAARNMDKKKRK